MWLAEWQVVGAGGSDARGLGVCVCFLAVISDARTPSYRAHPSVGKKLSVACIFFSGYS